ncbi:non-heme iron oxygenase ferredoxin subunit [Luteimonas sp. e5]
MSEDLRDWEFVCTEAELLPGEKKTVWHGDTPILVVNLDGNYYAVHDQCTHEDFELSAGEVDGERGEIECVLHGAKFNLRSGEATCPPAYTPVARFPVKVVDGAIWTRDDR